MTDTPNLKLPYLLAAQAQKHVTHNEALRALDAVVQLSVLDRDAATPPGAPANGARYIVAASPSGAWAGQAGKVAAFQDAAWMFYTPQEGWLAWVADENVLVVHDGANWALFSSGGGSASVNPVPMVGINTTADATNRLSVNSAASLFNHAGTGGHQLKLNKAAATDTASMLFQTGFSGRAEIGTTGDDKLHLKVSSNGSTWTDALTIAATGNVGIGVQAPSRRMHVAADANLFNPQFMISGASDPAKQMRLGIDTTSNFALLQSIHDGVAFLPLCLNSSGGNIGIGTNTPTYQLHVSTDSAAKPGTNTWTISSDERLKENIVAANLQRCWDIVKGVPLKRYTWRGDAYSAEQVADRSKLGWIAQDVQPFFKNAVAPNVFSRPSVEDGVEAYQEQATVERIVARVETVIEVRDGRPVQTEKTTKEVVREPIFDLVGVVDEAGQPVMAEQDGALEQILHPVPRMITKTRPKMRTDVIEDCLSLNADQIYAAMYGALQHAIAKIETLERDVAALGGAAPRPSA